MPKTPEELIQLIAPDDGDAGIMQQGADADTGKVDPQLAQYLQREIKKGTLGKEPDEDEQLGAPPSKPKSKMPPPGKDIKAAMKIKAKRKPGRRMEGEPKLGETVKAADPAKVDQDELAMGTKEEMEHTTDVKVAERIALEHLAEDPSYYSKLKKAGLAEFYRSPDYFGPKAEQYLDEVALDERGLPGAMKAKKVLKRLLKAGWEIIRQTGSHKILKKATKTIIFAFHSGVEIGRRMLAKLQKQTGVKFMENYAAVDALRYAIVEEQGDVEASFQLAAETIAEAVRRYTDASDVRGELGVVAPGRPPSINVFAEWRSNGRPSDSFGFTRVIPIEGAVYFANADGVVSESWDIDEHITNTELANRVYGAMSEVYDVCPTRVTEDERVVPALYRVMEREQRGESISGYAYGGLLNSLRSSLSIAEGVATAPQRIHVTMAGPRRYYFEWTVPAPKKIPAVVGTPDGMLAEMQDVLGAGKLALNEDATVTLGGARVGLLKHRPMTPETVRQVAMFKTPTRAQFAAGKLGSDWTPVHVYVDDGSEGWVVGDKRKDALSKIGARRMGVEEGVIGLSAIGGAASTVWCSPPISISPSEGSVLIGDSVLDRDCSDRAFADIISTLSEQQDDTAHGYLFEDGPTVQVDRKTRLRVQETGVGDVLVSPLDEDEDERIREAKAAKQKLDPYDVIRAIANMEFIPRGPFAVLRVKRHGTGQGK